MLTSCRNKKKRDFYIKILLTKIISYHLWHLTRDNWTVDTRTQDLNFENVFFYFTVSLKSLGAQCSYFSVKSQQNYFILCQRGGQHNKKKVRKQLFSTTLSSQFTHHCSAYGEQNLLGDIILCINNPNWASKSLCKHLRILGKHRAVIIVIYPLSVVIIYPFAIISFAVTQRACCPDIPRPSAGPGHASHQPTSHLPPSHNTPFGMASVCSADLPTKDY